MQGSEDTVATATKEFHRLFRELRNAPDGMGGFILSEKRIRKYLPDVMQGPVQLPKRNVT